MSTQTGGREDEEEEEKVEEEVQKEEDLLLFVSSNEGKKRGCTRRPQGSKDWDFHTVSITAEISTNSLQAFVAC